MAKSKSAKPRLKWKSLGFLPECWDESRLIKYHHKGFLYLCRLLRNNHAELSKLRIRLKYLRCRPGQGGYNCSIDWDGLNEAIFRHGGDLEPPELDVPCTVSKPSKQELEQLGQTAYRTWRAVREQQRLAGDSVADQDLRLWEQLSDAEQEPFRKSGEALAIPDRLMWTGLFELRKRMGEKAFRRKLFELSLDVFFEQNHPSLSEAERYRTTHVILGLSEMLEVPATSMPEPKPAS